MNGKPLYPICISTSQALATGAVLEPLFHPKPGGVTRIDPHGGHSIFDFELAALSLAPALYTACLQPCRDGRLAMPVSIYLDSLRRLGVEGNVNSGSFILLVHLAFPSHTLLPVEKLVVEASRQVSLCGGRKDADAYYRLLAGTPRSYLGKYEGPLGDAMSGVPRSSFYNILRYSSWDLVHREMLEGYPLSLQVYYNLKNRGLNEDTLAGILLELLASKGDTFIARKYGWKAYKRAIKEAKTALFIARKRDATTGVIWLSKIWRPRGWSPGAVLDIIASGISLYYYDKLVKRA